MEKSDLYERKVYPYEVTNDPNFLASRGFDVFEKAQEYKALIIERMQRAAASLESEGVPYAVAGGNAVASWVASVDPAAVRSTQDVDILLKRDDLDRAKKALEKAGFLYRHAAGLDFFIDGPNGRARDGVHIVFAGEKVRPEYNIPAPEINEVYYSERGFYVTTLEAIVRMKLTSNRRKDQVHIDDLVSVGLIDKSWLAKLPDELAERLRHLLENPED